MSEFCVIEINVDAHTSARDRYQFGIRRCNLKEHQPLALPGITPCMYIFFGKMILRISSITFLMMNSMMNLVESSEVLETHASGHRGYMIDVRCGNLVAK